MSVMRKNGITIAWNCASHTSGFTPTTPEGGGPPELFTKMSMGPSCSRADFTRILDARPICEVGGDADRAPSSRGHFGDCAIDGLLRARDDRDRDALGCERLGDASADAFAAAEHQRGFSLDLKIHLLLRRLLGHHAETAVLRLMTVHILGVVFGLIGRGARAVSVLDHPSRRSSEVE